ncbi:MAG TPA: IS630 family transposase [Verrucomicrobiota bacterium]|nr:IS630 family transposase [Verrucomicrobiota bacterium]
MQLSEDLGLSQRDIAFVLDVSEAMVSEWITDARRESHERLRSTPHLGRPPKLTEEQQQLIPDFLWHGAEAYGFRGEVWTGPRVRKVLAEEFGVWYSPRQVERLLQKLGWTPQVPLVKAIQADPVAMEQWRVEVWPEVKERVRKEHRTLVFIDESGFYLLPEVVRTYAPKGSRPVQKEWQTNDHLSVMGALTPQGRIYSLVRQEALNGLDTIDFLIHLLRVAGERLLVVWDNSPIHRRREVKEFLAAGAARRIHLEPLPPYAPELNPVEWLWGHCKGVELRNLACLDLEELHMEFHLALGRIRQKPHLAKSFFAGAKLIL